jgi:hypothetical protein
LLENNPNSTIYKLINKFSLSFSPKIKKTMCHHTLNGVVCDRHLFLGCSKIELEQTPHLKNVVSILDMTEKYQENLGEAIKNLQIADHMTYITLPLVNDNRLLLKIFDNIYKSIIGCINAILNYEYLYKRIKIYKNTEDNLQTFTHRCAKNYNLTNEQIRKIQQIITLNKQHKQSAMEFVKQNKIVILSDSLGTQTIDVQKIKEFLLLAKELLMHTKNKIKNV